ncbi:MAG TPA: biotin--[acetyl-CoA-carboxylase] ligase [Anaerolineae bacterium]|nr:biotin--[acetyl-CoA-carboxylase] ligase [Anaerolineae bacterium]
MNEEKLIKKLQGLHIAEMRFFETIGSTNEEALQWAFIGAGDNSLVIANQQTAGRGRGKRRWITIHGSSLAFSLILKPTKNEMLHLPLFSPLGALAVSEAAESLCKVPAQVKWPNDVLLYGKKAAGILAESCWVEGKLESLVVGIGVNIAPESVPPLNNLLFPATCLEIACSKAIDRLDVLKTILENFFSLREKLGDNEFFNKWQKKLAFKGEEVYLYDDKNVTQRGTLIGVDQQGYIILKNENGQKNHFPIGDLHLRPLNH